MTTLNKHKERFSFKIESSPIENGLARTTILVIDKTSNTSNPSSYVQKIIPRNPVDINVLYAWIRCVNKDEDMYIDLIGEFFDQGSGSFDMKKINRV